MRSRTVSFGVGFVEAARREALEQLAYLFLEGGGRRTFRQHVGGVFASAGDGADLHALAVLEHDPQQELELLRQL